MLYMENTLVIDFSDEHFPANELIDPEVVPISCRREVVLDRPLAPPSHVYELGKTKLSYDMGDIEYTTPYAFTFTFPSDLVPSIREPHVNRRGELVESYIKTPMGELPFNVQWKYFLKLFKVWVNRLNNKLLGKQICFQKWDIYPELTKQGVIHAHGLFYINSMYYSGVSDICAMTWANVSKAKQHAMIKSNGKGGYDKAFDKCTNIESWTKYITKGYEQWYPGFGMRTPESFDREKYSSIINLIN